MASVTTQLPVDVETAIADQAVLRGYGNAADYLRDLVGQDVARSEGDAGDLKAMLDKARASGVIAQHPSEVIEEIIRDYPAPRG